MICALDGCKKEATHTVLAKGEPVKVCGDDYRAWRSDMSAKRRAVRTLSAEAIEAAEAEKKKRRQKRKERRRK